MYHPTLGWRVTKRKNKALRRRAVGVVGGGHADGPGGRAERQDPGGCLVVFHVALQTVLLCSTSLYIRSYCVPYRSTDCFIKFYIALQTVLSCSILLYRLSPQSDTILVGNNACHVRSTTSTERFHLQTRIIYKLGLKKNLR